MTESAQASSTAQASSEDGAEGSDPTAVRISRKVKAPIGHVWEVLVSEAGSSALLGEGAVLGTKGEDYHAANGVHGVLRSYHPLEQLRVSWHRTPEAPASMVELDLRQDDERGTILDLLHDHLPEGSDVAALSARWESALDDVAQQAET